MASDDLYFINEHVMQYNAFTTNSIGLDSTQNAIKAFNCLDVPSWRHEGGTSLKGGHGQHVWEGINKTY